jgi:hypothetical protein
MDIAVNIASGALYKLYDDVIDTNTPISSFHLEIIKVLLVMTTTIVMVKNQDLSFFFSIMTVMCYFVNQVDTDFYKAFAITPFLISLLNIPYLLTLSVQDIFIRLSITFLAILIIYLEAKMIPEEMSPRKYISRISLLAGEAILAYLAYIYGFEYLVPGFLFFVGYFLSNVLFHFPTVYRQLKGEEEIVLKKQEKGTEEKDSRQTE